MITRLTEWHRIVNTQPTSDTIDRRTTAVREIVKGLDDASEWAVVLSCVAGVVAGFEDGRAQDTEAVQLLVSSIKQQDSAFPQDVSDNALELRAAAATAVGEMITRSADKSPDDTAVLLALLVDSGLGLRPQPKERYIAAMLAELHAAAKRTLASAQQARRRRVASLGNKVISYEESATEPMAAVKALTTALKSTLKEFARQSAIDREELEILWWLFGGACTTTGKQLSDMTAGAACMAVGVELADLCLLPPPGNADAFVSRAMDHVRKAGTKRAFDKVVEELDAEIRALVVGDRLDLVREHPVLFPLTWLCGRLADSDGAAGWPAEFEKKAKLPANRALDSAGLALQAFRERVARRQYASQIAG